VAVVGRKDSVGHRLRLSEFVLFRRFDLRDGLRGTVGARARERIPLLAKNARNGAPRFRFAFGLVFGSYCDLYCTTTLTKDGGIEHLAAVLTESVMGIPPLKFTEMAPVSFAMLLSVRDSLETPLLSTNTAFGLHPEGASGACA
jgi:hypothetical protein